MRFYIPSVSAPDYRRLFDGVDLPCLPDGHARLDDEDAREQRNAVVRARTHILRKLQAGRAQRSQCQRELERAKVDDPPEAAPRVFSRGILESELTD